MCIILKKRLKAYMTVEASMIMPLMVMILIVTVYWAFYTYNNCVIYQDCYIASLRGCQLYDVGENELRDKVTRYARDLLDNQLFQYQVNPKIKIGLWDISVEADTYIDNKVEDYMGPNRIFSTRRKADSRRIDPVKIVRSIY